ncbi:hypothetical protein QC762_203940 [Podospora pseudocomata]|uniref:Uncharacterized protein n=1 Tax=Podospora pseudocomata TaxID=2093779 RepID=A0ABR0GR32_9PEZI|nr:hypothetical protein QC762_203940 [Podospora pseudocomata]
MSASLPATTVSIPPQLAANIESWGVTHARVYLHKTHPRPSRNEPTSNFQTISRNQSQHNLVLPAALNLQTWSMTDPISIRPGVQQILWQRSSSSPNTRIVESPPDLNYPWPGLDRDNNKAGWISDGTD